MTDVEFIKWFNENYKETRLEDYTDYKWYPENLTDEQMVSLSASVGEYTFKLKPNKKPFRYSVIAPNWKSCNVCTDHISCVIFEHLWKDLVKEV